MNLYQFINTVKQIVLANKDVNTFNEGDVYEIMNSGQHTYPATVLTINNITTNEQTHYQTINCVLFYIDRLTDDYSNKTMIMSQGFNVLKQIKDKAVESLPWTFETANYTPYTEKFGDLCAGVYLECTIVLEDDVICSDTSFTMKQLEVTSNGLYSTIGYDTVLVSVNEPVLHYIEINENGEYTPQEGVDGFSLVVVNVPDPELEELSVTANGTYTPTKYGYSKVDVNVPEQKPEQTKTVNITENGTTSVLPDEGSVLSKVDVNVNVPDPELEELSVIANGTYTPTKYGYSKVNVNVAGGGTIDLSNGTKFGYSNFSEIPYCDYSRATTDVSFMFTNCKMIQNVSIMNFKQPTNMNGMFQNCESLKNVSLSNTHFVTSMRFMFQECSSLKSVQLSDTSNVTNMWYMFYGCTQLEEITYLDTSNVTDMSSIFANCSSLTTLPQLDASKLKDTGISSMFSRCTSLTNFGGLKNVGKSFSTSVTSQISFADSTNLSDESIQNIIDGLYDRTGVTTITRIKFHTTVKNKLTNEQKKQIKAKNWTLQ